MKYGLKKQHYVISYLKDDNNLCHSTNVIDKKFVDGYIERFPSVKFAYQPYGAPTCKEVGQLLSYMYKQNILKRYAMGLSHMLSGFPKWVYDYTLNPLYKDYTYNLGIDSKYNYK